MKSLYTTRARLDEGTCGGMGQTTLAMRMLVTGMADRVATKW